MFPSEAGLNFRQLDGGIYKGVKDNKEQFLQNWTFQRLENIKNRELYAEHVATYHLAIIRGIS
jgi:hypothetical protein